MRFLRRRFHAVAGNHRRRESADASAADRRAAALRLSSRGCMSQILAQRTLEALWECNVLTCSVIRSCRLLLRLNVVCLDLSKALMLAQCRHKSAANRNAVLPGRLHGSDHRCQTWRISATTPSLVGVLRCFFGIRKQRFEQVVVCSSRSFHALAAHEQFQRLVKSKPRCGMSKQQFGHCPVRARVLSTRNPAWRQKRTLEHAHRSSYSVAAGASAYLGARDIHAYGCQIH